MELSRSAKSIQKTFGFIISINNKHFLTGTDGNILHLLMQRFKKMLPSSFLPINYQEMLFFIWWSAFECPTQPSKFVETLVQRIGGK